ncbi:MAG TPA: hypothetical protein VN783_10995 [Thermoanaerobaculia bacterium]|nr:hypothetical protein [Thermoanaerobaculia bacterium]
MPSQLTIFSLMLFAAGQGAGEATLSDEAAAYLHDRYYAWIVTEQPGRGSPLTAWAVIGTEVLACAFAVGQTAAAASGGGEIGQTEIEDACIDVETESGTYYCPIAQT